MDEIDQIFDRLSNLILAARYESLEYAWALDQEVNYPSRDIEFSKYENVSLHGKINNIIRELDEKLPNSINEKKTPQKVARNSKLAIREFSVSTPQKILRGYIIPAKEELFYVPIPPKVFAFFLTIKGAKEILDRHLRQGIHYHYALANKTHTTTMICWDNRLPHPENNKLASFPIFHELHGKGSKKVRARPEGWSDKKRISVKEACEGDLKKWDISEFRCASNEASSVWPRNLKVTPRSLLANKKIN